VRSAIEVLLFVNIAWGLPIFVKSIGGSGVEDAQALLRTPDGGFALAGYTTSSVATGAFLLVRVDSAGEFLWAKALDGPQEDIAYSLCLTADSGFVLAGRAKGLSFGNTDATVSRFSSAGAHLWTRVIGGPDWDEAHGVIQTDDGGFVLVGYTYNYGAGVADVLVSKLDASGNHLWTKVMGGDGNEAALSVAPASDGGFVVAGETNSFGAGDYDAFISRFDSAGNYLWTRTLGGSGYDLAVSVVLTSDGGFAVAGYTSSYGVGGWDMFVASFDSLGNYLWMRTLGGDGTDVAQGLVQASDGGFVLSGYTNGFGAQKTDMVVAKIDAEGNCLWANLLGGTGWDELHALAPIGDTGFLAAGITYTYGTGTPNLLLASFDIMGISCAWVPINPISGSPEPIITSPSPETASVTPGLASPNLSNINLNMSRAVVCDFTGIETTDAARLPASVVLRGPAIDLVLLHPATLAIYDVAGRELRRWELDPGSHTLLWGQGLARGAYVIRLMAGPAQISKIIVKPD
jgi:hypothetical protein